MSPRNLTLRAIEEAKLVPLLQEVRAVEDRDPSAVDRPKGWATWSPVSRRAIEVPEIIYTQEALLVWLHEIGHLMTLGPNAGRYYRRFGLPPIIWATFVWHAEALAWKWVRATLGADWTPQHAAFAARNLNSYRKSIKRLRLMHGMRMKHVITQENRWRPQS